MTAAVRLRTGREMPALGLGTWQLDERTAESVEHALRIGYRLIDTSGDYGTQPGIAEGLRRTDVPREEIYVVTKVEEDEDAYESAARNVAELGLERADLVLIHRPPRDGPGVELWEGLMRARDEGVAADIGVSNYSVEQIEALLGATGELPAVNQVEWSPFGWSSELLDWCRERGVVIQAYSPLTRTKRLDEGRLEQIASEYGRTTAQVLLRWSIELGVVPLPKASRAEHREENLGALDFELRPEHVEELGRLNERYSSLGDLPYE